MVPVSPTLTQRLSSQGVQRVHVIRGGNSACGRLDADDWSYSKTFNDRWLNGGVLYAEKQRRKKYRSAIIACLSRRARTTHQQTQCLRLTRNSLREAGERPTP